MKFKLLMAVLLGVLIGEICSRALEAQSPNLLFVSSSAGPVPAKGTTAGVLQVNGQ